MTFRHSHWATIALAAALAGACTVSEGGKSADTVATTSSAATTTATTATTAQPATPPASVTPSADSTSMRATTDSGHANATASSATAATGLRVEVDLKAFKATLYQGVKVLESHPVAVGSTKWPTQPGEWTIKQVVFNPEWIPPDESWAEEKEPRKPGDPKNPLGMAQIVYDPPRTIHGTNEPSSIGKAVSHGSIRMANTNIVSFAKRILAADGAAKDAAWYQRAATDRTTKQIIDLPKPIPIKVF